MSTIDYRKLEGMELKFVSGELVEKRGERAIGYSVAFDMSLDFTHFVQRANAYIPGYLESPINAIRPELTGLAYHNAYNYFADAAGQIGSSEALFSTFVHPFNYLDVWADSELERRYHKPVFTINKGGLSITAQQDFRWEDPRRRIEIADLPTISFQWALNLMLGHSKKSGVAAPSSVVVLMYTHEERVEADGIEMLRGTQYMKGRELSFGTIKPGQILTAS